MPEISTHPSAQALALFSQGKLSEAQAVTVAAHLENCADCRKAADSLPPGSFEGKVRAARPGSSSVPPGQPPAQRGAAPSRAGVRAAPTGVPPELANHPKFRIVRELGRGGMGVIYLAEHRVMDKPVALKVISPSVLDNPDALARFHAEVRAAGKLDHQNIARAYDADQAGSLHFLVMEFVEGTSLAQVLERKGPLAVGGACHLVSQAALGLQHAHERGMVHRDIKPHNLMLTPKGLLKVLDFGLARMRSQRKAAPRLTQIEAFMGTPEYVSPEQAADAREADIRADIYSLGCTLYALLTGRPPFLEDSVVKLVLAHIEREPQPLHELRADAPPELAGVVAKMLAKDPAQRYQTPVEVVRALAPFVKAGSKAGAPGALPSPPPVGAAGTGTRVGGDTSRVKGPGIAVTKHSVPAAPAAGEKETGSPFQGLADAPAAAREPEKQKRRSAAGIQGRRRRWLLLVAAASTMAFLIAGIVIRIKWTDDKGKSTEVALEIAPDVKPGNHGGVPPPAPQGENHNGGKPGVPMPPPAPPFDPNLRRSYRNIVSDWTLEGDELVQKSKSPGTCCELAFGDFTWKDYDFSCEAKRADGGVDLGLRYHVTAEGYACFQVGAFDNKAFLAYSVVKGKETPWQRCPGQARLNDWNRLRLEVRDNHCKCYLNDNLVLEQDDAWNIRGAVGIDTYNTTARFRNIRVTDPSGNVLFEGLPELPATASPWPPSPAPASASANDDLVAKVKQVAGIDLVAIPKGSFLMGAPDDDKDAKEDEKPQHKVTISKPFYLSETKVTVGQFKRFVEATGYVTEAEKLGGRGGHPANQGGKWTWRKPGYWSTALDQTDDAPVVCVSWNDAKSYCDWLAGLLRGKRNVRFPREAEWEYSCRANSTTKFYFGDDPAKLGEYAWFRDTPYRDGKCIPPVRQKKPNDFKLYDMHGLVGEWCWDGKRKYTKADESFADPEGPTISGGPRVIRGGAYGGAQDCRAAARPEYFSPSIAINRIGFRVLIEQSPADTGRGFVPLFNGKDLAGWKTVSGKPEGWEVKDGILTCRGNPSYLFTERDFENFHLKAEVRANQSGNSGLFFRSEYGLSCQFGNPLPAGYEVEVNGDVTGSLAEWRPNQNTSHQLVKGLLKTTENWFWLDVIANGDDVVVKVDGQKAVDRKLPAGYRRRGHVALQHFAPGTVAEFRTIKIEELPANAPRAGIAVKDTLLIATWSLVAAGDTHIIRFYADRCCTSSKGPRGMWELNGTSLVMRWPNSSAPGGAWIDSCTLSDDGKKYRGKNQSGLDISGVKISGGDLAKPPTPADGGLPLFAEKQLTEWTILPDNPGKGAPNSIELHDGVILFDKPDSLLVTKIANYKNVALTAEVAASKGTEAFFGLRIRQKGGTWEGQTSWLTDSGSKIVTGMQWFNFQNGEQGITRLPSGYDEFFTIRMIITGNDMQIFVNGTQTSGVQYGGPRPLVEWGRVGIKLIKGSLRIRNLDVQVLK